MANLAPNEVGVAYVTLMPSMKEFNNEVRKAIKENMNVFSGAVNDAGDSAIDGFENVAKKLANSGGNYGREAGSSLGNGFLDAFTKALGNPSAALSSIMAPIVAGLSSAFNDGMSRIRTAFSVNIPWATAGAQASAQITAGVNAAIPAVAKVGADIGKTLSDSIGKSGAKEASKSVKEAVADIDNKVLKTSSNISQAAKKSADDIKAAVKSVNTSFKSLKSAKEAVAALPESGQKLLEMTKDIVPVSNTWNSAFSSMADSFDSMPKEIPLTDYTVEVIDDVVDSVKLLPAEIDDVSGSLMKLPDVSKLANIGGLDNITAGFAEAGGEGAAGFVSNFKAGFSAAGGWAAIGVAAGAAIVAGLTETVSKIFQVGTKMAEAVLKAFADASAKICKYIVDGVKAAYSQVGKLMLNLGKAEIGTAAKNLGINLGNGVTDGLSSAKIVAGNIISGMISSATSAVTDSISSAISRVDTMNNFPKILGNMGIGAEDAEASIAALSEAIDGLPTRLDEAALGTERLVAKNGDIAKSTKYFTALNNAIIAGGASTDLQSSAVEQLTQAYSKGAMDMMEWRSLQQAMPAQLNQIAQSMNMTSDELGEGLRNGTISMDAFMDQLVILNEQGGEGFASFAEQAKTSSKTIGVALTNLQGRITKATAAVIDWVGQENIFNVIESISSKFGPMAEELTSFLDKIEAKRYIGEIAQKFSDAIGQISEKAAPLKEALSPILENALPAALATVDATLNTIISRAEPFFNKVADFVSSIPDMAEDIQPIIDAFVNASFDTWTAALEMWQKVIDAVAPELPKIIDAQAKVTTSVATLVGNLSGTLAPVVSNLFTDVSDLIAKAEPFVEKVVTGLVPVFETIEGEIVDIVGQTLDAIDKVTVFTRDGDMDLITYASQTLSHVMATVGDTIGSIIETLTPYIPNILDMVDRIVSALAPAVDTIVSTLAPYIPQLADLFASSAEQLAPSIAACVAELAPNIPSMMEFVSKVVNFIAEHLPGVAGTISNIWQKCSPIFDDVIDIADNVLPGILGIVNGITDAIGGLYDNLLKPILQLVKDITDFLKDPSWDKFAGQFTGNTHVLPVFDPGSLQMAEGGIATRPTRALIAEAGVPEAVVPLSAQGIQKFTSGLAPQYAAGGAPTVTVNIDSFINHDTSTDVRTLSEEIGRDTLRQLKMQGVYA